MDGERSQQCIDDFLKPVSGNEVGSEEGNGVYPNLFCVCPPFQIDGNFGILAGICEMLLQNKGDRVELLPAIPKAWKHGRIKGLRAKGGKIVDVKW
jgi:alpha-L-fucosidase 2